MTPKLNDYAEVAGQDVIDHLHQLARPLNGLRVVHVNSTREGGGVAEILNRLVPLMAELGLDVKWETIQGGPKFFECTKTFHNALQGNSVAPAADALAAYEETNRQHVEILGPVLRDADVVFIHDPQPAPLLRYIGERRGRWVWRCHIDASRPFRPVWRYLRDFIAPYDASVFSLADFAQVLPHPEYLIPPSIDPLAEKNVELDPSEISAVLERFGIDSDRPLVVQVSRFDRFKDPVGVIHGYRLAKRLVPGLQLVLAGGGASDDPEGDVVLREVRSAAEDDADVKVLLLPSDAHRIVNALQRAASVVMQKSTREGFGLTVTEGMWKGKPVIGGDTGGIRLQVVNHHTGFLVRTPEGAALRLLYLLQHDEERIQMGIRAREHVRDNFLLTRHLREYLTLIVSLMHGGSDRVVLS
jgi:trehalose synthase